MVGIDFPRQVGPCADTKELEYVSALHQSGDETRPDGSIRVEDIQNFLSSRHGVRVDEEVVLQSIVQQLGGSLPILDPIAREGGDDLETAKSGDQVEDEVLPQQPVLDICQLLAMLMIPFLRKGNAEAEIVLANGHTRMNASTRDLRARELKAHQKETVGLALDVALRNILAEIQSRTDIEVDTENLGVTITPKVLGQILELYGEFDVPPDILEEMIEQAQTDEEGEGVFFDRDSFLTALTADTQLWSPKMIDGRESTHFDDARKAKEFQQLALYGKKRELTGRRASSQQQFQDEEGNVHALPFETIYMASNIDNTADTYRSTSWFILIWFETVLIYFGYMLGKTVDTRDLLKNCKNEFGCAVAKSLVGWLTVFFQLMIMGFSWVFMASLGNTTHPTETLFEKLWMTVRLLVGMAAVSFVSVASFATESDTQLWDTEKTVITLPAAWTAFFGGLLILWFQLLRIAGMYVPLGPFQAGGMEKKEKTIKNAASYKVLRMAEHAMVLHEDPSSDTTSTSTATVSKSVLDFATSIHSAIATRGDSKTPEIHGTTNKALLNFHRMQDAKEDAGGVIWFVTRALDGTIFEQEGIYLHGRLLAVNLVQFFISALMVSLFVFSFEALEEVIGLKRTGCTVTLGDDGVDFPVFDEDWNTTEDGYENVYNINATHFALDPGGFFVFEGQLPKYNEETDKWSLPDEVTNPQICFESSSFGWWIVNSTGFYPNQNADYNEFLRNMGLKEWEWRLALVMGLFAAFAAVMGIACVQIPSFTSTVLKFRCGYSPSLKGDYENFGILRNSPDHTQILFGTSFWGAFYTAAVSFFFVAGVTFVCVYSQTRPYIRAFTAICLGALVTMLVKVLIMRFLRGSLYGSFYRKKPAASNIMNVILECYALATSGLTVTTRFIKLLLVTALYIGRIDTPMLAPGVGNVGPLKLDSAPNAFKVDLLSHEAHRHPYIERLGLLYLLKLYNGKKFGNQAGAHWRILFVLALMPWMRVYRIRPAKLLPQEDGDVDDIMLRNQQVQNEMDRARVGMQLEIDLTVRAYNSIRKRNADLEAVLVAARDKIRELKQDKKVLTKRLLQANSKASEGSSQLSSESTNAEEGHSNLDDVTETAKASTKWSGESIIAEEEECNMKDAIETEEASIKLSGESTIAEEEDSNLNGVIEMDC